MFLIIVGKGQMGQTVRACAKKDEFFDKIEMVEPLDAVWPQEKADLIIDFSHPKAMKDIYEYCHRHGGGIPVVIGTTGQGKEEEILIKLLEKICPVVRKTNFSRGIEAMNELVPRAKELLKGSDISVLEIHHSLKKDSPSGTAKTLCKSLELDEKAASCMRIGNMPGQHTVYFALEDELIEIRHTAFSKKIFALGAINVGKMLIEN